MALRTTNKKVKTALIGHVMANFLPINYGGGESALQNLKDQIDYMRIPYQSIYQTALNYVEGGSLIIYYGDVRDFLKEILEQTNEEADRYSDDKVWRLYCHLIARTMSQLYSEAE